MQGKTVRYTSPWLGLMKRIKARKRTELYYDRVGYEGSISYKRDPEVSAEVPRLKTFARDGNGLDLCPSD